MVLDDHGGGMARLGIGHALGMALNLLMLCAGCIYMHGTQQQAGTYTFSDIKSKSRKAGTGDISIPFILSAIEQKQ